MWGDCSPSAVIDCQMVQPALNPFLADIPGIQGRDGSEMLEVDRAMMRDLPYSEPTLLLFCALAHDCIDASRTFDSHKLNLLAPDSACKPLPNGGGAAYMAVSELQCLSCRLGLLGGKRHRPKPCELESSQPHRRKASAFATCPGTLHSLHYS